MTNELTGRHVLVIVIVAFGTIIAANLTMLFAATGTFPGLVVGNSYVAGVGWDSRADAQRALGWSIQVQREPGGLRIDLSDRDGVPVTPAAVNVAIGRPTTSEQDQAFVVTPDGTSYRVPVELGTGRWRVDVAVDEPASYTVTTEVLIRAAD